jgi:urease accessory protein
MLALSAAVALIPSAAVAHAPVPGVGVFWNGVLHPVLVPLHLLALLALGLALGQNAPGASRIALPAFALALAAALALSRPDGTGTVAILAVALAASLLVVLGRGARIVVLMAALAVAAAVGLDSPPVDAAAGNAVIAAAGTLTGAVLVVVLSGGVGAMCRQGWQRIAVRTAGSWIAAVSAIALALAVADGPAVS